MMSHHKDRILGIAALIIAAFFTVQSMTIVGSDFVGDPGPKVFPLAGCAILALCGVGLVIKKGREGAKEFFSPAELKRAVLLFGCYVLYVFLLWFAGFMITLPVILFIISYLFSIGRNPSIIKSMMYAALVAAAIYLIYVVIMKSQVPTGVLWKMIG